MGIIFKKNKELNYKEELSRGLALVVKNKDYSQTKMGGDSILRYLINALLIWMLCYSSMDCVMSAFDITYKKPITMFFLMVFSLLVAFMHLNKITKAVGYVIVLAGFGYMVITLRLIINTGFSQIVNVVMENLEAEFMLPVIRRFRLYNNDVEMSVSVCLVVIGLVLALILNITVSEYMNPILTLLITFPIVQIGMYLDLTPDINSLAIYVGAIVTVIVMRYSGQSRINEKNEKYHFVRDKNTGDGILGEFNPRVSASVGGVFVISVFVVALLVGAVAPDNFTEDYEKTFKRSTNTYVREFAIKGIRMFFDTEGQGGLNSGRIGDVGIIHMDYETDLIVTFVPTSSNRQYLRNYVGVKYTEDSWDSAYAGLNAYHRIIAKVPREDKTFFANYTALVMKNRYLISKENSIKSKMVIQITDGSGLYSYSPYYVDYKENAGNYTISSDVNIEPKTSFYNPVEVWYYPYAELGTNLPINSYPAGKDVMSGVEVQLEAEYYEKVVKKGSLEVPKSCKSAVKNIIDKYGFTKDDPMLVSRIASMFRQDYEYTLMPGTTPKGEDYVTYFLEGNKKGFCAHFSSATVMIFRELGIPARYAEGYVVDWGDVHDGKVLNEDVRDWITFANEDEGVVEELKVVETQISDAKAHAWVEIYIKGFGWVPVDVTPPRNEDDEYSDAFGGLLNLFGGGDGEGVMAVATTIVSGGAKITLLALVFIVIGGISFLGVRMVYVRNKLRKSFMGDKPSQNLISFFLYIKLLLKAKGEQIPNSMIERECIELFAINVGMKKVDVKKLQVAIEKAIYSRSLDDEDEKNYEALLNVLEERAAVLKGQIPLFRRIVYSVWYGI